jgi:IS1 family transposase
VKYEEKLKDKYHDCGHRPRNTDKRKRMAKVKPQTQNEIQQPTGTKAQADGQGSKDMRRTPRTNAAKFADVKQFGINPLHNLAVVEVVDVAFARQLELELLAMNSLRSQAQLLFDIEKDQHKKTKEGYREAELEIKDLTIRAQLAEKDRDWAEEERVSMAKELRSEKEMHVACQNERDKALALLAEMKQAVKWARDEAKERLQRLDSAACERRQWMESEHRAKKAERESFAMWCESVGHLSTIAEDCEAWLNSESDKPSVDFIKAVRDYAKKAINNDEHL